MKSHQQLAAALNIAAGAIYLLIALLFFVILASLGGFASAQGEHGIGGVIQIVGVGFSIFIAALGLPSIIAGWAFYTGRSWARPLLLVVAVLHLLHVPIGTALGVYTLWAFWLQDQVTPLEGGGGVQPLP